MDPSERQELLQREVVYDGESYDREGLQALVHHYQERHEDDLAKLAELRKTHDEIAVEMTQDLAEARSAWDYVKGMMTDELEGAAKPEARLLHRLNLERLHFIDEDDWTREASDTDDRARVATHSSRGVGLHRRDPLVAAALERFDSDPAIVTFLASAVYTVLNEALREVTHDDERSFHLLLAERAARRLGGAA